MVSQSHNDESSSTALKKQRMSGLRLVLMALVVALLAACTASWRAPVESRGSKPSSGDARSSNVYRSSDRYRVRRGDTLYKIAWQRGIDYRAVARWNGIRPPYRIYEGQTLRLTPPARVSPPPARQSAKKTPSSPSASKAEQTKTQAKAPSPTTRQQAAPKTKPPPPKPSRSAASGSNRLAWRWPVDGPVVSTFNARDEARKGIKIRGRDGAVIRAAEAGKVVYSGSGLIGYGRLIIVKHNDNYLSAYGHNKKILVAEADRVTKGQKIAEMGTANDGRALLHFEIRRNGKPVDPIRLLPRK